MNLSTEEVVFEIIAKFFENFVFNFKASKSIQRLIRGDVRVPYRTLYPNATEKEWRLKNKAPGGGANPEENVERERMIRVLKLHDPDVDPENLVRRKAIQKGT